MFNLSTQEVVSSIEKTPIINEGNFVYQHYHNFFGSTDSMPSNTQDVLFERLKNQEKLPRKRMSYNEERSKQLTVFFMNSKITNALQNKFSTELKFSSVDYWIDDKGYFLPSHVDNNTIKLSLQIYIGEDHPGTVLFDKDKKVYVFPFKNNSGYAMLLNSKTFHGLEYPVKRNGRKSVYVRYQ
jgi:hypothetical protein